MEDISREKKAAYKAAKTAEECASANDCTGAYQIAELDPETVKKLHKKYNRK